MKIYHYHPTTGEFLGEGVADLSPLEENVWLIPAHATTETPPELSDGFRAVLANNQWHVEPIPEPTPEPTSAVPVVSDLSKMTAVEKLAAIGLSIDDLKTLLAS